MAVPLHLVNTSDAACKIQQNPKSLEQIPLRERVTETRFHTDSGRTPGSPWDPGTLRDQCLMDICG